MEVLRIWVTEVSVAGEAITQSGRDLWEVKSQILGLLVDEYYTI